MGNVMELDIDFSSVGDLLSMWIRTGPSESGAKVVTLKPNISSFYKAGDKLVGIYWFDACKILMPVLERGDMSEVEKYPELLVDYCRDTDTLTFGNREPVVRSHEMATGLTAHIDRRGLAGSFTMENASAILLHHFRNPIDKMDNTPANTTTPELSARLPDR